MPSIAMSKEMRKVCLSCLARIEGSKGVSEADRETLSMIAKTLRAAKFRPSKKK